MELDSGTARIRERTVAEVLDLTFLFLRQNAAAFTRLALLLGIPYALALWALALLLGFSEGAQGALLNTYLGGVIWLTAAMSFRLPFVALAGDAMFSRTPSVRRAIHSLVRRGPCSPWRHVVSRFLAAASLVGLVAKWLNQYCMDEMIMLEQLSPGQLPVRQRAFHAPLRLQCRVFFVANTVMGALVAIGVYLSWSSLRVLTVTHVDLELSISLFAELPFIAGLLLAQVYCSVAKFLFYLNLRTIHEGWDLFIAVRKARISRESQAVGGSA